MASKFLQQGKIIAYPTEAVYALGCDPLNEYAIDELLTLKQRDVAKGLILIAASLQQLQPYLITDYPDVLKQALVTWPGPTTWVIPAQNWVPQWLTGQHGSLAVRVSSHPLVVMLCQSFGGPVIATSANISGIYPAHKTYQIIKTFGRYTPYIIKGETSGMNKPTPIFDAITSKQLR